MHYKIGLNRAIKNTQEQGLSCNLRRLGKGYKIQTLQNAITQVVNILTSKLGLRNTKDVSRKCFLIHPLAKNLLSNMGIKSEVTIGNVIRNGCEHYPNATIETITKELYNPSSKDSVFNGHCWLTLRDGSILDFTYYCDLTNPKAPEPWLNNVLYVDISDYQKREYHIPFYLGEEFLEKTNCIYPQQRL